MSEDAATELLAVIRDLHRGSCFCEMGIGNPMYSTHTKACVAATAAIAKAEGRRMAIRETPGVDNLGRPWTLAPLNGKHYGTLVLDRDGDVVLTLWSTGKGGRGFDGGEAPSTRQQVRAGYSDPERWAEECHDAHYECQRDLDRAVELIRLINLGARIAP